MSLYLDDGDFQLYQGDVLEQLAHLPDESVNCVVTSPPYWGLRDYGTGEWDGGDPDCDHETPRSRAADTDGWKQSTSAGSRPNTQHECSCGARRVDRQLGLEPTPDEYVARMVDVFREVRRVLRRDGTCWVNLGDSYNANQGAGFNGQKRQDHANRHTVMPRPDWLKPKDLVGIPWRVAFALQADGWYLRADIIWSKPNPMPESVTDRPTKAHEYVFLLTRSPRYWFDQEAVREPHTPDGRKQTKHLHATDNSHPNYDNVGNGNERWPNGGRNVRSVWEIATQPYPEAHFATYPEELVRRCLLAGCPEWVCGTCGKPRERVTTVDYTPHGDAAKQNAERYVQNADPGGNRIGRLDGATGVKGGPQAMKHGRATKTVETIGWSDCGHNNYRPGVVLDPFMGSGTTAHVARKHGRRAIGIELNADYCQLAARRLQQLSLLAEGAT